MGTWDMATLSYWEHLPRIQAVQIALSGRHEERERLSFRGASIHRLSEHEPGGSCNFLCWDTPNVSVPTYSGLRLQDGVLHVRFKTKDGPGAPPSPRDELLARVTERECQLFIRCRFCLHALTDGCQWVHSSLCVCERPAVITVITIVTSDYK